MSLEELPVRETGDNNKKYQYRNHWVHTKNESGELLTPPLEVLNLLFIYDANTGSFKRKFSMKYGAIEPREITTINSGYRRVGITDSTGTMKMYSVHRLAWVMHTQNQIPMGMQVDHQDGDILNNRFENFRIVSNKVNTRNKSMSSRNTSGYTGVSWHKQKNKWTASIKIDGKSKHIGNYDSPEEANAARLDYVGRFNLENLGECFSYRHTNTTNGSGVPESISLE